MSVTIKPREAHFKPNAISIASLRMENLADGPLCLKVLCTDSALFRVKPVFAVIVPGKMVTLDVARLSAPPRLEDKLVIHSMPWPEAPTDKEDVIANYMKASGLKPAITRVNLIASDAEPKEDAAKAFPISDAELAALAAPADP